mmetsp:Transcript_2263/g.7122  ORF Transcript_2263/g.7122 Transcript_2263/m.7122 type:complete len:508 (-) Transcript_2263:229-1752(-)
MNYLDARCAKVPVAKVSHAWAHSVAGVDPLVNLTRHDLDPRVPLAHRMYTLRRSNKRQKDDVLLLDALLQEHADRPACAAAGAKDRIHQQHVAFGNVHRQSLVDDTIGLCLAIIHTISDAVHQNFPQLDALAAVAKRILHALPAPYHADAAELFREFHPRVYLIGGRDDRSFRKRQQPEPVLHDQPEQAVGVKDKVLGVRAGIPHDRVHPADLEIGGNHVEIWVNPQEIRLLQLAADVLRDQVDGHEVVPALPGNDHVRVAAGRCHKLVKRRLDKSRILPNHPRHVTAPGRHVALNTPRQAHIVIRVNKDLHMTLAPHILHVQHHNPLNDDDVGRRHVRGRRGARVRRKVVVWHLHRLPLLEPRHTIHQQLCIKRVRMIKVVVLDVRLLLIRQTAIERVLGEHDHTLIVQTLHNHLTHRRLARRRAPSHPDHEDTLAMMRRVPLEVPERRQHLLHHLAVPVAHRHPRVERTRHGRRRVGRCKVRTGHFDARLRSLHDFQVLPCQGQI